MVNIELRSGRANQTKRGETISGYALVDDEWANEINNHCWSRTGRYAHANVNGTTMSLHRFVDKLIHGSHPDKSLRIDHIDGDGLNNTKANLRRVTHAENIANTGKFKNNTSGYKGVTWDKSRGKWHAQVKKDQRNYGLGRFDDKDEAARAVNRAYAKFFPGIIVPNPEVECE
jgi:hypothetical protein